MCSAMTRFAWGLAAALLLVAAPVGLAQVPAGSPPLLGLPAPGLDAARVPAREYAFTDQAQWAQFWGQYGRPPLPRVDFSHWQIVAVFLGQRPNPGYNVHVTGYAPQAGATVVSYHESVPAPGAVYAQMVTYPYDLVAIPAGGTVRFARTSGPPGLLQPVARDLPYQTVDLSGLSPQVAEQAVAFTTPSGWQQFWSRYGTGGPPAVDFRGGRMVVGLVGVRSLTAVTLSRVQRAGGTITITLGPGDPRTCPGGAGRQSLLLIVPQVTRVDLRLLPFCK